MELRNFYFYTLPKVSKCFNTSTDITSPKQPWIIISNLVEWKSPYILASNPYFIRITVLKSHFTAYLFDPREKNHFFKNWEFDLPPPSVVFLNCCAILFYNGLRNFKLKYGHHENVVSLLSNYKFHENSCLVSFAKIII